MNAKILAVNSMLLPVTIKSEPYRSQHTLWVRERDSHCFNTKSLSLRNLPQRLEDGDYFISVTTTAEEMFQSVLHCKADD